MRHAIYLAVGVCLLLALAGCGHKTINDKPTDDDAGDDVDFSDIPAEACACERTCLLDDFDCKAACDAPEGDCRDACDTAYAECAVGCNGCIAWFTACYQVCGEDTDCTAGCDAGLIECQSACGWDQGCLAECNTADAACADECGGAWDCYAATCMPATRNCYAECI